MLNVYTTWEEYHQRKIDHRPGDARIEHIVCPAAPAVVEDARISLSVDWTDDLLDQRLWAICHFYPDNPYPRRDIADDTWTSSPKADGIANWLVIQPEGRLSELAIKTNPREDLQLYYFPFKDPASGPEGAYGFRVDQRRRPLRFYFGVDAKIPDSAEVHWPAVSYRLGALAVGISPDEELKDEVRRLDVPALLLVDKRLLGRAFEPPRSRSGSSTIGIPFERGPLPAVVTIKTEDRPLFEAVAGEANHWTIKLPEELLTHVREQLGKE